MTVQKRESDLVLGTFGRGFYILDDFSPLREITAQALGEEARLLPLRNTYAFSQIGEGQATEPVWTAPNLAPGAVFTYHVAQDLPADTKLVITITDDSGRQVRRLDVPGTAGLRRITWNLRGDPVAPAAGQGGPAGRGGEAGGGITQAAGAGAAGAAGRGAAGSAVPAGFAQFGGRGGGGQAVAAGRYRAVLGKMIGDAVTPVGPAQTFMVVPLPDKNY
jgi:hypothetical protein